MRWTSTLPFITLAACTGAVDRAYDRDDDGFDAVELGGPDCDDADPAVNPDQPEICGNTQDDDCDGNIDDDGEGSVRWYADADFDGFGAVHPVTGCVAPPDSVPTLGAGVDCDDTNPDVNPDAVEIWYDGVDQDCDENDADADFDGHPSAEHGGDDCDDHNDAVNPSEEEVCNNHVDDDCDGGAGACRLTGVLDVEALSIATFPSTGTPRVGNLNGDLFPDVVFLEGDVLRIYFGPFAGEVPASATRVTSDGRQLDAVVGDVTGDGLDDLVIDGVDAVRLLAAPIPSGPTEFNDLERLLDLRIPNTIGYVNVGILLEDDQNGDAAMELTAFDRSSVLLSPEQRDAHEAGIRLFLSPHSSSSMYQDPDSMLRIGWTLQSSPPIRAPGLVGTQRLFATGTTPSAPDGRILLLPTAQAPVPPNPPPFLEYDPGSRVPLWMELIAGVDGQDVLLATSVDYAFGYRTVAFRSPFQVYPWPSRDMGSGPAVSETNLARHPGAMIGKACDLDADGESDLLWTTLYAPSLGDPADTQSGIKYSVDGSIWSSTASDAVLSNGYLDVTTHDANSSCRDLTGDGTSDLLVATESNSRLIPGKGG